MTAAENCDSVCANVPCLPVSKLGLVGSAGRHLPGAQPMFRGNRLVRQTRYFPVSSLIHIVVHCLSGYPNL